MIAYLAHPIDHANPDAKVNGATALVVDALARNGHATFDPARPYMLGGGPDVAGHAVVVEQINDGAIRACDGMVAILDDRTPTIGTPVEVWRALSAGKPVVVFWLGEKDPGLMLTSWGARRLNLQVVQTLAGVLDWADKVAGR